MYLHWNPKIHVILSERDYTHFSSPTYVLCLMSSCIVSDKTYLVTMFISWLDASIKRLVNSTKMCLISIIFSSCCLTFAYGDISYILWVHRPYSLLVCNHEEIGDGL